VVLVQFRRLTDVHRAELVASERLRTPHPFPVQTDATTANSLLREEDRSTGFDQDRDGDQRKKWQEADDEQPGQNGVEDALRPVVSVGLLDEWLHNRPLAKSMPPT